MSIGNPQEYFSTSANHAEAIQRCVNEHEHIVFPPGIYEVTNEVRIPSNRLLDLGASSVVGHAGIEHDYTHRGLFSVIGSSSVTVRGGILTCDGTTIPDRSDGAQPQVSLIRIANAKNVCVDHVQLFGGCTPWGSDEKGVIDITDSTNVRVSGCQYIGPYVKNGGNVCRASSFVVLDPKSIGCAICQCAISGVYGSAIAVKFGDSRQKHHQILGNSIKSTFQSSVSLNSSGCIVSGNTFSDVTKSNGIAIGHNNDDCNSNIINGNVIRAVGRSAVVTTNRAHSNVISNNVIEEVFNDTDTSDPFAGVAIRIRGPRNCVNGNRVRYSNDPVNNPVDERLRRMAISVEASIEHPSNQVCNSICGNIIHGGRIVIRAPYTNACNNVINSGVDSAFEIGPWARFSTICNNTAYDIPSFIRRNSSYSDTQHYEGLLEKDNIGKRPKNC